MALTEIKTCDLCGFSTKNNADDTVAFGDWMHYHGITVHYFCLLLSTKLPQRGEDLCGILGFLLRDIRLEILNAKKRKCFYCNKPKASIACHTCKKYFHLVCGHRCDCLFQFSGEFRSYCHECLPLDDLQLNYKQNPSSKMTFNCYICKVPMSSYNPVTWIYANCCGTGFVHRMCIRKYALTAGYYLVCIWCRSKKFREHVRLQGVFVPDRDAQWEREKNAYAELHRGHQRCDMEVCNCPKGRNFSTTKWKIITCSLCGSFGVHNPMCIPGKEKHKTKVDDFKCDTCRKIEDSLLNIPSAEQHKQQIKDNLSNGCELDYSLHINKITIEESQQPINETPIFSDEDTDTSCVSTSTTILHRPSIIDPDSSTFVKPNMTQSDIAKKFQQTVAETTNFEGEDTKTLPSGTNTVALETWADIEGWPEFDSEWNCIGSCTLHINLNSPRFAGKTIAEICEDPMDPLITDADKTDRSNDKGIFKVIDAAIDEFLNSRNQEQL